MKTKKITIVIPEEIISILEKMKVNKNKFFREAAEEKLRRTLKKQMIEGYKKEKNLKEWEITVGEGID